jgi:hypothetical protein
MAVDPLTVPLLQAILPRGSSGETLKFSSRDLSARALAYFVDEALATTSIEVCLVMISMADVGNAAMSRDLVAAINERRASRHNPYTTEAGVIYGYALGHGVFGVLEQRSFRTGRKATFVDLVLDDANISRREKTNLSEALRLDMKNWGSRCGDVRWTSERLEPMLSVCDLFAGVYRRQAVRGDVTAALQLMEIAEHRGRIRILDGVAPLDPAQIRKGTREASMIQVLTFGKPDTMQDPHREVTVVHYPFTIACCGKPGPYRKGGDPEDHSIIIELPNRRSEVIWGFSPGQVQKVAFAYAKQHVVRKMRARSLERSERMMIDSEGLRPPCPFEPDEVEMQIGIPIKVEVPE